MNVGLNLSLPNTLPGIVPGLAEGTDVRMRTVIVGTGPRAATLARSLARDRGRSLIGVTDSTRLPYVESEVPDLPWLGGVHGLRSIVVERAVDEICVAVPLQSCFAHWLEAQAVGRELGVSVSLDLGLLEDDGAAPVLTRDSDPPLLRCNVHPSTHRWALTAKRMFDVVGAGLALILLSPVLLSAAALVKLTSRGPVLFRQPRVGRSRRSFPMLKFRTMVENAEDLRPAIQHFNDAKGIMFKISRDPRLTVVGPLLRRTSIDELPQLINVLRGEMSLVGPRPIPIWVFDQIDEPSFHRRFSVLPGMTGLWQVLGRQQQYQLMAAQDLAYVDRWTLWMDVKILLQTPGAVVRRRGAL